ncbi:hypothetical protein R6Q59_028067 [Mikania micrantha]
MVFCGCGKEAVIRTSWTSRNLGSRFYSYPEQRSNCSFITWVDPEMCPRSILIIPGLLKSKNEAERKCRVATEECSNDYIPLLGRRKYPEVSNKEIKCCYEEPPGCLT